MANVKNLVVRFVKEEEGASLVEYGLLVALIALACIVALGATGTSLSGMFNSISTTISGVDVPAAP